jgi:hypothetical protein
MSFSREELISELARLADELGTTSIKREMITHQSIAHLLTKIDLDNGMLQ